MHAGSDLRRSALVALCGVIILFLLVGGAIAAFGTGANRPEGVAERWLVAVGDTQRKGVRDRSREDAEEVGPLSLAAHLLPEEDTDGKSAFVDLEVGRAVEQEADDGTRRVPFRLHQRQGEDVSDPIDGTIVLAKRGEDWKVVDVGEALPGLEVPSEGGAPAADAPWGLYLGAVGLAVLLTGGCTVLVRLAERPL
jgi:hypothetical protein